MYNVLECLERHFKIKGIIIMIILKIELFCSAACRQNGYTLSQDHLERLYVAIPAS